MTQAELKPDLRDALCRMSLAEFGWQTQRSPPFGGLLVFPNACFQSGACPVAGVRLGKLICSHLDSEGVASSARGPLGPWLAGNGYLEKGRRNRGRVRLGTLVLPLEELV